MSLTDDIYYDPYDYEIDANPHPLWKRMRDEMPLYHNQKFDFYAVSRYADVRDMSVDWRTFSSARGSVLEIIQGGPAALEQIRLSILFEDPPPHDVHRALLARSFTPRRISALEAGIREMCRGYLDELSGADRFDFVRDYGGRIPTMVIGMLLGVPDEDRTYLRSLADESLHRAEGETDFNYDAQAKMIEYYSALVERRRKDPADDLITDLVNAEVQDENGTRKLDDERELLPYIALVSAAGNETVANLMGWAGLLLHRHPDQRRALVENPALVPNAVEELLRYEAPSPIQARYVTRDVELHGQKVPEGSAMVLITGSAGRDERQYKDPDRFDVTRGITGHVSLGYGIHFCLGAALARLESRVGLEEVLARYPEWEVDEENSEMVHTSTVRGWDTLPVAVH